MAPLRKAKPAATDDLLPRPRKRLIGIGGAFSTATRAEVVWLLVASDSAH